MKCIINFFVDYFLDIKESVKVFFKKIATYIPKDNYAPHRQYKRIFFIKKFLNYI